MYGHGGFSASRTDPTVDIISGDTRTLEGITINIFLLASLNQTEEYVRFAYRLAESTRGRVFFTAGKELDRYVVWELWNRDSLLDARSEHDEDEETPPRSKP
jgi:hypothetical protein